MNPNHWTASVALDIPGHLTLDDRDSLVEKVRETALPMLSNDGRRLVILWGAESEWDLRGLVGDTLYEIESGYSISTTQALDEVRRWQGEAEPFA
jgi:hypothetical protein